jgi:hypothetical protein
VAFAALRLQLMLATGCVGAQFTPIASEALVGERPEELCETATRTATACGLADSAASPLRAECLAHEDRTVACALACARCDAATPLLNQVATTPPGMLWRVIATGVDTLTAAPGRGRSGNSEEGGTIPHPAPANSDPVPTTRGGREVRPGQCNPCQSTQLGTQANVVAAGAAAGTATTPGASTASAAQTGLPTIDAGPNPLGPYLQALLDQMVAIQSGPNSDGSYRCACASGRPPIHRDG